MKIGRAKRYCIANGCSNHDKNVDFSFFTLPKDIERCKEWLAIVDRQDLLRRPNFNPISFYVCSAHFNDSSFKKCGLKSGSMPIKISRNQAYSQKQEKPTIACQTCLPEPTVVEEVSKQEPQTSKPLTTQSSRKRKLSEEVRNLEHSDEKIIKIEKKSEVTNTPITSEQPDDNDVAERFNKLIEWQNRLKNKFKGNRYDTEYKIFALNLYNASHHAYRFLQTFLKLPNRSTIDRLKINISPKIDDHVMKSLEFKIKSLPETAKYCTICVEEMSLKKNLYYDAKTDELIGLQNLNGNMSPVVANYAYIITLQGIHVKWKQPLAYALLSPAKHYAELDLWLEEVISKLFTIGIKVKAITSDPGSNFGKFTKEIKNVTPDKPYFMYGDKIIFCVFDVPHLFVCIRNNLITNDFYFDDQKIAWDYIKQLYDHQKHRNFRLIPKITKSHIDPTNFKKVQYAVQVFSRTVSAALHTYIDFGIIAEDARPTANFVETMNNLFDILNSSKIQYSNKYKAPLRGHDYQEEALNDAFVMISKIKAFNKNTKKNMTADTELQNAQISILSIKMLHEDLKKEGIKYIFTRRLNQDSLDNCFVTNREQNGSCTQLTPIQFKRAFSKLFVRNMLKSSQNANCEADLYDILLQAEDVMKAFKLSKSKSIKTSVVCLYGETDHQFQLPKKYALTYVSAYLLFKCFSKHKCHSIDTAWKSAPDLGETKLLTNYEAYNKKSKFYGALKMPPNEFIQYIQNLEDVFTDHFETMVQTNPGAKLYKLMKAVLPLKLCTCFPVNYLIVLFIRLRIYTTLRFNNQQFKNGKGVFKEYIKVKHLQL